MQFKLDQLGKTVLREIFVMVGTAETEVEVPAGDTQRIDLWHVPDPALLRAHPEIGPGVLRALAEEACAVEVFSDAPGEPAFHAVVRKRFAWHHVLEMRAEGAVQPLPWVWLLCAGRPDGVLSTYGFVPDNPLSSGVYVTSPVAWRIRIVVVSELPRIRETILLRLLGSPRTRQEAQRDLLQLAKDAWERQVALKWLSRLRFVLPVEELTVEYRELLKSADEWWRKNVEEPQEKLRAEQAELRAAQLAAEQALASERLKSTVQMFELRLQRPLTEAERATVAKQLEVLGRDRVAEVALTRTADAAAAWLAEAAAG
jgi:hypothetical protein